MSETFRREPFRLHPWVVRMMDLQDALVAANRKKTLDAAESARVESKLRSEDQKETK